jgi:hypothetical protein
VGELGARVRDCRWTGRWTGLSGAARGLQEILSVGKEIGAKGEEIRELDSERLLVLATATGRAKRSGLSPESLKGKGAALLHVREGRVTRFVLYFDRDRAFADLGLEPDAD